MVASIPSFSGVDLVGKAKGINIAEHICIFKNKRSFSYPKLLG